MPSKLFVWRAGIGVVPVEEAPARESFHFVHNDEMAPTWHPADSKIYTSKRNFRSTTKSYGYTEVGNELLSKQKPKPVDKPLPEKIKKFLWDRIDEAYHKRD